MLRKYYIYVGDDQHPPRERKTYKSWSSVRKWLFEHCYTGEPLATAEKGVCGKWHAVVRVQHTRNGVERIVICQSRHWKYTLDRTKRSFSTVWQGL